MKLDLLNGALERALGAATGGDALPAAPASVEDAIAVVAGKILDAWVRQEGPMAVALDQLIHLILTNPKDPVVRAWGLLERQQIRLGLKQLAGMKAKARNAEAD